MMWPFREGRADVGTQDATEVAIAALAARAAGRDARPETLAALEIAASYVGRAFASAVVTGPEAAQAFDPRGFGDDWPVARAEG